MVFIAGCVNGGETAFQGLSFHVNADAAVPILRKSMKLLFPFCGFSKPATLLYV
jgi:hypothetical protein